MKKIILFAAMALLTVTASAQVKLARVNFTELYQLTSDADAARSQMAAAQKEAQETFQSMYEEYQTKLQEYQQKQSTWTPAIKDSKEKELGDIQSRLQDFQQSIQQELSKQEQDLYSPIIDKAHEAVNKLAKAGGYAMVFDSTQYLYVDDALCKDLTADARKALGIPADRTLDSLQKELEASQQAAAATQTAKPAAQPAAKTK